MEILQIIVVTLFFICCAVLVFLILIQAGKGGGLGMFGGGGSSTPFGTSTVDIVAKTTWWGAAAFFILALLAAITFADYGPELPVLPGTTGGAAESGMGVAPENAPESNSQGSATDSTATPEQPDQKSNPDQQ